MSDEKQLTVAELLARASGGAEDGEQNKPRRRRRRNLEEGGVSVAELTGSIPKVKAKPAEARHSSVPLDHDSAEDGEAAASEKDAAESTAEKSAAGKPVAEARPDAKPAQTPGKPAADKSAAEKPAAEPGPAAKPVQTEGKSAAEKSAAGKPVAEARPGAKPAQTPAKPAADKQPAKAETPTAKGDAPETVAEKPTTGAGKSLPSKEDTAVIDAIEVAEPTEATQKKAPTGPPAGMGGNVAAAAAVPAGVATGTDVSRKKLAAAADAESTGELAVVDSGADPRGPGATAADGSDVAAEDMDDDAEAEEGISVWAMLGLALIGVIIGVVVFLVFDQLWTRFPNVVVGIAALVVTGLMVVGTKLLRTVNDGLSMTLAGIVGLLMTFGPALILAF